MRYSIQDSREIFEPGTHPEKLPYKLIVFKRKNKMDTRELYELLSKQITEMDTRFTNQLSEMDARFTRQFESLDTRLESLDTRLRNVEVDVAEIKGQKAGWDSARNWVSTGIALIALGVAIAVALWK